MCKMKKKVVIVIGMRSDRCNNCMVHNDIPAMWRVLLCYLFWYSPIIYYLRHIDRYPLLVGDNLVEFRNCRVKKGNKILQ